MSQSRYWESEQVRVSTGSQNKSVIQERGNNGVLAHWCPRYESGDMAVW